ncbi:MAG: hypothetical protein IKW85_04390 [Muribaculaceae bacterium]|nr:hypothetical protein [Muribaculaceae bacterium]
MRKILFFVVGLMAACGVVGCGPSQQEIAEKARQDSIRIADSLRVVDSLRIADSIRVADSLRVVDSIAVARIEGAKIDKLLDDYERHFQGLRDNLNEGNLPPSSSSYAVRFAESVGEVEEKLNANLSKMTPEQQQRYRSIEKELGKVYDLWAERDGF